MVVYLEWAGIGSGNGWVTESCLRERETSSTQ